MGKAIARLWRSTEIGLMCQSLSAREFARSRHSRHHCHERRRRQRRRHGLIICGVRSATVLATFWMLQRQTRMREQVHLARTRMEAHSRAQATAAIANERGQRRRVVACTLRLIKEPRLEAVEPCIVALVPRKFSAAVGHDDLVDVTSQSQVLAVLHGESRTVEHAPYTRPSR